MSWDFYFSCLPLCSFVLLNIFGIEKKKLLFFTIGNKSLHKVTSWSTAVLQMKSRYLLNSCNSTSQFISVMCRCFVFLFFYQIKNFLFLLWVNLYMITGIYLHDPPPFNGPFFMTPPFSESQKVETLPLFPPPPPC